VKLEYSRGRATRQASELAGGLGFSTARRTADAVAVRGCVGYRAVGVGLGYCLRSSRDGGPLPVAAPVRGFRLVFGLLFERVGPGLTGGDPTLQLA